MRHSQLAHFAGKGAASGEEAKCWSVSEGVPADGRDIQNLVFVSTREGGTANLWILDLTFLSTQRLTAGAGGDFRPSWSPDGKWIAFSSGRGKPMPFSEGRWERLQLADLYVVHPDGSGLKKIPVNQDFCGSPKWMGDSRHVVAYCMTAQETLADRMAHPGPG